MNYEPEDPKLTAYALGEADEAERAEIEAWLASNEAARKYVDEIRATAAALRSELNQERGAGLTPKQHRAIARASAAATPARLAPKKIVWIASLSAVAALIMAAALLPLGLNESKSERSIALAEDSDRLVLATDVQPAKILGEKADVVSSDVTATYQTANGTAVAPDDFTALAPAVLTIPAGSLTGTVTAELIDNGTAVAKNPAPASKPQSDVRVLGEIRQNVTRNAITKTPLPVGEGFGASAKNRSFAAKSPSPTNKPQSNQWGMRYPESESLSRQRGARGLSLLQDESKPNDPKTALKKELAEKDGREKFLRAVGTADRLERDVELKDGAKTLHFGYITPEEDVIKEVEKHNTETFAPVVDNPFLQILGPQNALSTFSIDVDTASYSNVRRYLNDNTLPPADAVRIEEMINYFKYDYAQPTGDDPFAAHTETTVCPWNPEHRLVRIGLKGREIKQDKRPPSNLVFLVDVSGSMNEPNRLPLVQSSLKLLVDRLNENDRVALVVYAGSSGLVLPSTSCDKRIDIYNAIDRLKAGGSTNGGSGIQLAYDTAVSNFIKDGVNRVVLATDGDWNVGVTNQGDLVRLIEEKAKTGVFLSVLGYGMGNYKDGMMEQLADKGNGNYAYIDTIEEARKVLVEQMAGTLVCIAKDVKIQVEFNPAKVNGYRLIGYENRVLAHEDFNNDKKDAGDIGAGHTVTALYEIVPAGAKMETPSIDPLKYQIPSSTTTAADSNELLTLKLRYKQPDGQTSKKLEFAVSDSGASYDKASTDFKFAAAVAAFGMVLRESPYKGSATFDSVLGLASECVGGDNYRSEFIQMVNKAKQMKK